MSEHTQKEAILAKHIPNYQSEVFKYFEVRLFVDFTDNVSQKILAAMEEYAAAGRSKSVEEKEKEIERLKGLIREGFSLLQTAWGKTEEQKWNDWEKFKTENQL